MGERASLSITPYFARAVSYFGKMFMKLNTGGNLIKLFCSFLTARTNMLARYPGKPYQVAYTWYTIQCIQYAIYNGIQYTWYTYKINI
jgi:hypothetical protein